MKTCKQTLISAIVCGAGAVIAAPIPIENHSFEADENTSSTGGFSDGSRDLFPAGELTAWIEQSPADTNVPAGKGVAVGWKDISVSELDPFPAVGGQESQALSLQSGASVLNTTGTAWSNLNVGDTLTLTISLGMRTVPTLNWTENTFFGLTDGDADFSDSVALSDTVANSGVIANNPVTGTQTGDGTFTDVSFDYVVQVGDTARNGNVGIFIYSQGSGAIGASNQSFFDNVRLDLTPGTGGNEPPRVISVVKSGSTVTVAFEGGDGLTYDLNKSTDLDFTTPDIKDTVTLSGSTTGVLEDAGATEDAAFYRVEQQ